MRRNPAYALVLALALSACAALPGYRDTEAEMTSMAVFDPARYLGTWYEVARFPVPFQKGCTDVRAIYGDNGAGGLTVRNTCRKDGETTAIDGTARVVGPGRLEVRLNGVPFAADYWVLWVDEGYRTAVVGVPSGRAGWILNRDPQIPADRLRAARAVLEFNGYDVSRLQPTAHGGQE